MFQSALSMPHLKAPCTTCNPHVPISIIFSSVSNSSQCLTNCYRNFRLTERPSIETCMISDNLIISTDLLNSMNKSLFVVCLRNFEFQYLTFTCWSCCTLTEGPFDSSVWYGLDFHHN